LSAKTRVYLLGPMTGYPDFNRPAFRQATAWLRSKGYAVISPDELDDTHPAGGTEWKDYMRRDIPWAVNAEVGYALPGWRQSRGAILETCLMQQLGIPVVELREIGKKHGVMQYAEIPIRPEELPSPWLGSTNVLGRKERKSV
jgi:hypothetical protein